MFNTEKMFAKKIQNIYAIPKAGEFESMRNTLLKQLVPCFE